MGETSILRQLQERRFDVVEEVAALQRRRQPAPTTGDATAQVHDRSPICTHALGVYLGRPVPETLSAEIERITRERIHEQSHRRFGYDLVEVPAGEGRRPGGVDRGDHDAALGVTTPPTWGTLTSGSPARKLDRMTKVLLLTKERCVDLVRVSSALC